MVETNLISLFWYAVHREYSAPVLLPYATLDNPYQVSTFALGTLGASIWQMNFRSAALTILFFNLLSTLVPAYFATFGKALGIRALAFYRFTFGYYVVLIPTILNLIACIGWSVINSIAGGLVLRASTHGDNRLPLTAAIIIIGTLGFDLRQRPKPNLEYSCCYPDCFLLWLQDCALV